MGRNTVDLTIKVAELRKMLVKYGGIPSQTVDRKAYALIKSYLQRHSDAPEIIALVEEFSLITPKRLNEEEQLEKVKKCLNKYEGIPSSLVDDKSYRLVKRIFKAYSQKPEVIKLMYLSASNEVFSLQDENRPDRWRDVWGGTNAEYYQWRQDKALQYISYVYERYGVLPYKNTKPMEVLWHTIDRYLKYQDTLLRNERISFLQFMDSIFKNGYKEELKDLYNIYRTKDFDTPIVQKRINDMLIKYGACTIEYIANHAIDGISLPLSYVHHYYMNRQKRLLWNIRPLGLLGSYHEDSGREVLYVHYRDYYKCNINEIMNHAKIHFRNWLKNPPITDDDHIAYAQSMFFCHTYPRVNNERVIDVNWEYTIVQNSLDNCDPSYFYDWGMGKKIDFYLFLLEEGYCEISKVSNNLITFTTIRCDEGDNATLQKQKYVEQLLQMNQIVIK